jgi:hypothetical protein
MLVTKGVATILAKEEMKLIRGNDVISALKEEYKASFTEGLQVYCEEDRSGRSVVTTVSYFYKRLPLRICESLQGEHNGLPPMLCN